MTDLMSANFVVVMKELQKEIHDNAAAHGFYDDELTEYFTTEDHESYKKVNLDELFKAKRIALIHSEISEGLEGIRKPHQDQHCPQFTNVEIELADAVIRILDTAQFYGLNVIEAILTKHDYNKSRPHKHGKAF